MITNTSSRVDELELKIKQLEAENRKLRDTEFSLLKELPEIVFIIDYKEQFSFLNRTCIEKFKLSPEDVFGKLSLKNVLTPSSMFKLRRQYFNISIGKTFHVKVLHGIRTDGTLFPFTAYFTPLYEKNNLTGFIGIGFDISEQLDIESKLNEANLAKMKFLSIIAHDLRNPFNSLLGFSTLLLKNYDKYTNEKVKEYIFHMSSAANQGHQLLENLLDWAKANTRKIDINPIAFNLGSAITETIKFLSGNSTKKEIAITFHENNPTIVFADQNMIRTVLRNLVSNAIKFTPRNGFIQIELSRIDEVAVVQITDNGVGIESEKLSKIFTLNNDTTSLGTEKEKGTGLGLILCYEFVTLNKGEISATSIPNYGSTFWFSLPLFKTLN